MLKVTSAIGNIFVDKKYVSANFEKLKVTRADLQKRILRKRTEFGTDVGWCLDHGILLCNGDILRDGENLIVVDQIPEKVIVVRLKKNSTNESMVILGHVIGNRHRPISVTQDEVVFPIHGHSEKKVFEELFHPVINNVELTVEERVFSPHLGADVHEHG